MPIPVIISKVHLLHNNIVNLKKEVQTFTRDEKCNNHNLIRKHNDLKRNAANK